MKLYITGSEGASFAVLDANWGYLVFPDDPNFDPEWNSISVEEGTDVYEIVLTAEHLETAMTVDDGWSNTAIDRKSTRLNSSHVAVSYAVFCLKKKKKNRLDETKQ